MFSKKIRLFFQDTRAAVAFEAIIMTPVLALAFVGSFVLFDAYRTYNTSIKATYAIADVLSRQNATIGPTDIEGLSFIFENLVRTSNDVQLRATQVWWDGEDHLVDWSDATGGQARLFDANMEELRDRLPPMVENERLLVVETFIPYRPAFNMGLDVVNFSNFTFTRPRRSNRIPWDDSF